MTNEQLAKALREMAFHNEAVVEAYAAAGAPLIGRYKADAEIAREAAARLSAPVIDDAMVERACEAWDSLNTSPLTPFGRTMMRAALRSALAPKDTGHE